MDAFQAPKSLEESPWWARTACSRYDSELWFPEERPKLAGMPKGDEAKRICNTICTVREECLFAALEEESKGMHRFGIRGGLTARERRDLVIKLKYLQTH